MENKEDKPTNGNIVPYLYRSVITSRYTGCFLGGSAHAMSALQFAGVDDKPTSCYGGDFERSFELQNRATIVSNIIYLSFDASDFKSQFMLVERRKSSSKYSPMFLSILSNYSANETFFLIKKEHKVLFKDHARLGNNTICNIPFTPT